MFHRVSALSLTYLFYFFSFYWKKKDDSCACICIHNSCFNSLPCWNSVFLIIIICCSPAVQLIDIVVHIFHLWIHSITYLQFKYSSYYLPVDCWIINYLITYYLCSCDLLVVMMTKLIMNSYLLLFLLYIIIFYILSLPIASMFFIMLLTVLNGLSYLFLSTSITCSFDMFIIIMVIDCCSIV